MQKVLILPLHEWKRVQKKPSLVTANDGLMEYLFNANIYIILKLVCWQAKE
ncbi:hypothetical protein [Lactiplantibacillus plantarum]|uniref:hypothetical protein n=1 Tax=Lactiplantibacillus plantarum TaxID=1590 RepID=UPI001F4C7FCF|nr:hypothetical protein [Lactiplantibacillus plantarum]MCH8632490.1 hypothetical protein [Lactiplantibacillus plantarum]MCH8635545.1 hypothetical protein [Lactiplantibacillus plantarum]